MASRHVSGVCLLLLFSAVTHGNPALQVIDNGVNVGGNREWLVEVSPDPALFSTTAEGTGGSLAVELALEVTEGTFLAATKNATDWPYDNPGNNPFTNDLGEGVVIDLSNQSVFVALGSEFFTSETPVELLTIVTSGEGLTTLSWGGQTILSGTPQQFTGGRLAQAGQNFDDIAGSLTLSFASDFNLDGAVDASDAGYMFSRWATNDDLADINADGIVDAADASTLFSEWTGDGVSAAVPEACSGTMLLVMACGLFVHRRQA